MLRWFDTSYAGSLCELVGLDPLFIKKVLGGVTVRKPQKSISDMTTRELKKYIRRLVKKANTKLRNIGKRKRGVSRAVQQEIDYLKRIGIINKHGKAVTGYRLARKPELQKRARELEYFDQWKGSETKAVAADKDYKKYQSIINNRNNSEFANYSYQDWKDLVSTFGSMEGYLNEFEYEDMKQLHKEATQKGTKKDLLSAMMDVKKQTAGMGLDTEDLTDLVRGELFV